MAVELPNVRVQDSLYEVLKDVSGGRVKKEEAWVEFGTKEVRFTVSADGVSSEVAGYRGSISDAAKALELHSPQDGLTLVRFGDSIVPLKDQQRVTCGAVFGVNLLVGSDSGKLQLLNMGNPELNSDLGGHLLHTSVAKFFPSGQVALSAGMDYSMKLWDLQSGKEVQALRHQRGLVEDVALISRGRNMLSLCPSDAKAGIVLWEVGTPCVVHEYSVASPRCIDLWNERTQPSAPDEAPFYGVEGNVGIVGLTNEIQTLDIREPKTHKLLDEGATSISVNNNRLLYARAGESLAACIDLRMPDRRLFTLSSATPVTQVLSTSSKAYINTEAGTYGYAYQSGSIEVLCCSDAGVLTAYNDELWALGTEARHFPL